jgi:hypothetical protein
VVSAKPVVRLASEKAGSSEELILVDMERHLLFADKEKGGRNPTEVGPVSIC